MTPIVPAILAAMTLAGLAGIWMLLSGLRGHRINNHPVCRSCRFDLVGITSSSSSPAPRCPECGADVTREKAIQIGVRVRRPALAVTGAVLTTAVVSVLLAGSYLWISKTNVNPSKPTSVLLWQARHNVGDVADVLDELVKRNTAGTLSSDDLSRLAASGLSAQAISSRPWNGGWGDLIEAARAGGKLSDEDWRSYLRRTPNIAVDFRDPIEEGDPLVYKLEVSEGRCGLAGRSTGAPHLVLAPTLKSMSVNDLPVDLSSNASGGSLFAFGHGTRSSMFNDVRAAAPVGSVACKTVWEFRITDGYQGPELASWTEERTATVNVRPRGGAPIEMVRNDPDLAKKTRDSLSIEPGAIKVSTPSGGGQSTEPPRMEVQLKANNPPIGMAFELWLRESSSTAASNPPREWRICTVRFQASESQHIASSGGEAKGFDCTRVDVVLRPSENAARTSVDLHRIWGEEIVIENVSIVWPLQPPAAATTPQQDELRPQ